MESFRPELIPNPAVRRLSLYLRQLESLGKTGRGKISSKELGESLGLSDAQVRKDLAHFGQFGHPGVGYRVEELISRLRQILGTNKTWNVLLVGAGNLGRALMAYHGFSSKGFQIVAVADSDPGKIGKKIADFTIEPLDQISQIVQRHQIRLAMLAIPADVAQEIADRLISAGVRGLLNFAPISLTVPAYVSVNTVDVAVQLEQLVFLVNAPINETNRKVSLAGSQRDR